jgi:DNA-binding IclR family transcriptional regulator
MHMMVRHGREVVLAEWVDSQHPVRAAEELKAG